MVDYPLNPRIMRTPSILSIVAAVAIASPVAAQSNSDVDAYFTLIETPSGGLPPVLSWVMLNRSLASPNISVRYGHISTVGTSFNNFGATLGIPAGPKAVFGITAGYETLDCSGCEGHFIAGANAEGRLSSTTLGTGSDAAQLTIGLNGEFGFGKPTGVTLASLTGGVPIALVAGGSDVKIAPFLTPAIGWAHLSGNGTSDSGTRFMLGGGVTVLNTSNGISANVGFQKVFINGGDTVVGVTVSFGRK